jgi:hypothetical protein
MSHQKGTPGRNATVDQSTSLRTHPAEQVIAAYTKVLGELVDMRAIRAPEEVLPLPKNEMAAVLRASEHPKKEQLLAALDYFTEAPTRFLAGLVLGPTALSMAYTIAIAVQGASWVWVPVALLGGISAFFAACKWGWVESWPTLSRTKRLAWIFVIQFAELCAVVSWGAVWVRLVIVSGLYGMYQSSWVSFSAFGLVAAAVSLVLGYFFSKQFNAFFFFVVQFTKRRQFRQVS